MYRNVSYNNNKKQIILWSWDDHGNRISEEIPFSPYVYIEQKEGASATSIYKTPLVKREFETDYHRKRFVSNSGIKRIFYNLPPEQQFLIDRYHHITDWMSFTKYDLRTFFLDIECYSPDEFPTASEAKHPINLITIYDSLDRIYYTWGLKQNYYTNQDNVKYTRCVDESDLLKSFLRHWRKNFPDIMTGYNSDGFDIPYIVNRLNRIFGEDYAKRLSPTENVWSVEKLDRFNNPITEWNIDGISCIDFMKAYKKFSRNERESYSLDYIATYELGYGKTDTGDVRLTDLADQDWNKFVDYNVQDVKLIVDLEEKLHYLELCRMIGYKGLTKFEKALGTNNVVAGAFALEAKKRNQIVPTFEHTKGHRPPGGLVRFPENGFKEAIISFDAASLYPNTIISLNMSPETKIGKYTSDDTYTCIHTVNGKEFKLKNEDFEKWMTDKKICRSMYNTLFSQSERGLIPSVIDGIYSDRKTNKSMMLKLQKKIEKLDPSSPQYSEIKKKIDELDILQYTLKILMNSIYGTFGNSHSIMYDLDIAASITLTGQELNHQAAQAVVSYINKKYGVYEDPIIGGDTDSIFITIKDVLRKLDLKLLDDNGNISEGAMQIIQELGGEDNPKTGAITKSINKWAKTKLNSLDPRFEFKREKICDSGIFLDAKKRYILHVLNEEGIQKNAFKYTGIEVVSSTLAKECKSIIKRVIENMVMVKEPNVCNQLIRQAYSDFCKLSPEILASRKSVRDYDKYAKKCDGFNIATGTPQNSKASILYNNLINHLKLQRKYEKIKSGDKIKILYVEKNIYGIEYVGFKGTLPNEFKLVPDYEKIYKKNVHPIFERLFESVGWNIIDPTKNYNCDILSIFGED
jgi:DNA polymerase elongation subunit (family B)